MMGLYELSYLRHLRLSRRPRPLGSLLGLADGEAPLLIVLQILLSRWAAFRSGLGGRLLEASYVFGAIALTGLFEGCSRILSDS